MLKILLIAQRELRMTIARKAYLLSLVGLPLLVLLIGGVTKYVIANLNSSRAPVVVGVLDEAGVVDFELANDPAVVEASTPPGLRAHSRPVTIKPYSEMESALVDLREARLSLLCRVEANITQDGAVKLYTRNNWFGAPPPGIERFRALLRASLLKRLASEKPSGAENLDELANRLLAPSRLEKYTFSSEGTLTLVGTKWQILSRFLVPYGLILLLTISVFMSANYLLQATGEEKENRVIEVMLSSVAPVQLLWGKILGLGASALIQALTYVGVMALVLFFYGEWQAITVGDLALSLLFCLAGYLLYAGLLAAIGIMGGNLHNNSQLSTPLMMIVALPLMLEFLILDEPNGTLARVLSFIPLTAPLTMIYRLSLAYVPWTDIVIALLILCGSAYASVRGAAKIFRTASLMYGKRITGPEIVRWLKES